MGLGLRYKNEEQIFQEQYTEPPYLEYPMFRETGIVKHGFSTRIGGVQNEFDYFTAVPLLKILSEKCGVFRAQCEKDETKQQSCRHCL